MARFKNKTELKDAANKGYKGLITLISTLSSSQQDASFTFDTANDKEAHWKRDKNIRDILIHLYEWQVLMIAWVKANENGVPRSFLPEPYNWRTYGEMNVALWKKHQATSLEDAKKMLKQSHQQTIEIMSLVSDDKLFARDTYAGGSTIGQYFISTTVGHYDWAIKKIKRHIKEINSFEEKSHD